MGKRRSAGPRRPPGTSLRLRAPFALKLVVVLVFLTVGASLWQGVRDYRISTRRLDELTRARKETVTGRVAGRVRVPLTVWSA